MCTRERRERAEDRLTGGGAAESEVAASENFIPSTRAPSFCTNW